MQPESRKKMDNTLKMKARKRAVATTGTEQCKSGTDYVSLPAAGE